MLVSLTNRMPEKSSNLPSNKPYTELVAKYLIIARANNNPD